MRNPNPDANYTLNPSWAEAQGFEFGVWVLGFGVLGFWVLGFGFLVFGFGFSGGALSLESMSLSDEYLKKTLHPRPLTLKSSP